MSDPVSPLDSPSVGSTSAADARRLIAAGWNVDDAGLWSTAGMTPCEAPVALRVAEALAKVPAAPVGPAASSWWTHLASSMPGTAGVGILSAIATYLVANPPPEAGLSPQASEWLKWALALVGATLLGVQVPKSMAAAKG